MALLTYSVVRRHMKGTSGFTLCAEGNQPPVNLAFTGDEAVIGWYRNPAPWEGSLLVFTSNAIWTVDDGSTERIALTGGASSSRKGGRAAKERVHTIRSYSQSGTSADLAPDSQESPDVEPQPEGSGAEDTGVDSASTSKDSGIDAASPPDSGQQIDTGSPIDASDAATAPDVYEASTPVDASDAATHDTGVDAPVDSSTGGNCTGIPAWVEGTTAQVVTNDGHKYTCITPGWCSLSGTSAVLAYEPGTGSAWQEAWTDDGPCN